MVEDKTCDICGRSYEKEMALSIAEYRDDGQWSCLKWKCCPGCVDAISKVMIARKAGDK